MLNEEDESLSLNMYRNFMETIRYSVEANLQGAIGKQQSGIRPLIRSTDSRQ